MTEGLFTQQQVQAQGKSYLSLLELATQIKSAVDNHFPKSCHVVAEISNLKKYESAVYMELVEKVSDQVVAKIRATCWRSYHHKLYEFESVTGQSFINGIQVLLLVDVAYSPQHGLSLSIKDIDPNFTLGNVELQRRGTLEKLIQEAGVKFLDGKHISPNHGRPLPLVIKRIALIASTSSDGYRDFIDELTTNEFGYTYILSEFNCKVQGKESEEQILGALRDIFKRKAEFDIVVIVRGGGSDIDLTVFDSFALAKGCALFPIPVFTGIGHTRNESICDMMVSMPLKTPTKVAQEILQHNLDFESNISIALDEISKHVTDLLIGAQKDIGDALTTIKLYGKGTLEAELSRLEVVGQNVKDLALDQITQEMNRLGNDLKIIELHNPSKIMELGFALVSGENGYVSTVAELADMKDIKIEMQDGIVFAQIKFVQNNK